MAKQEELTVGAKCPDCGVGEIKLSKKDKKYCDQLCWMTPEQKAENDAKFNANNSTQTPQTKQATNESPDWDQIGLAKAKTALAVAYIKTGKTYNESSVDIELWLTFIKRDEPPV